MLLLAANVKDWVPSRNEMGSSLHPTNAMAWWATPFYVGLGVGGGFTTSPPSTPQSSPTLDLGLKSIRVGNPQSK